MTQVMSKPIVVASILKEKIDAIDLEPIKFKLTKDPNGEKWALEKVNAIEKLYKGFLYLVYTHKDKAIVPTKEIDTMWHHHILDTQKYYTDCQNVFGEMIHHFPYLGLRGAEDIAHWQASFKETENLFKNELDLSLDEVIFDICSDVIVPFETIERFAVKHSIPLEKSAALHQDLLQYLDKQDKSSPTQLVDEVWHHFILHTRQYKQFCENRYGHFIHHIPEGMKTDYLNQKVRILLNKPEVELAACNDGTGDGACSNACGQGSCSGVVGGIAIGQ
jgi:hypothetical protein